MRMSAIGDLARNFAMQDRNNSLRDDIRRLTTELASGRVSDTGAHLKGDMTRIAGIEAQLTRMGTARSVLAETAAFAEAAQLALGRVAQDTQDLGSALITLDAAQFPGSVEAAATQARAAFETAVAALNGRAAGRSLFAGQATGQDALAGAGTILDALAGVLSGATGADDAMALADAWFADPAGFEATAYTGAGTGLAGIVIGEEVIGFAMTARDPLLRGALRDTAVAALAGDARLPLDAAARRDVLAIAGGRLIAGQGDLATAQARIGQGQDRLERATVRMAAERTSLEYARGTLLSADPFETATRLQAAQFQLESLYAVTARTAQLKLVNFLR